MNSEYDNEHFFHQYAQMPRSQKGLSAAGEWSMFRQLFPPLQGKTVLDLGCGYGWHCDFASRQGAEKIQGIDLSVKMIEEAKRRCPQDNITYRVCGIQEYEYPENTWDCVVSNLALHYIENLEPVFRGVHQTLKQDGIFLFNIEHPVFTAAPGQDWLYKTTGEPWCWPVDNYFIPGKRKTQFLGCQVVKYHHTLTQILMGLLNNGFDLEAVVEAESPEEMRNFPEMEHELRRPMMLLVRARAKKQ